MYVFDGKNSNTVREPVCGRGVSDTCCSPNPLFIVTPPYPCGGGATAYSVTGTGPGSACKECTEPTTPSPPPKLGCRVHVKGQGIRRYRANNGGGNLKVC